MGVPHGGRECSCGVGLRAVSTRPVNRTCSPLPDGGTNVSHQGPGRLPDPQVVVARCHGSRGIDLQACEQALCLSIASLPCEQRTPT